MSDTPNTLPYANPTPLAQDGDIFRDGSLLIVRDNTTLPPICLLCARASSPPIKCKSKTPSP